MKKIILQSIVVVGAIAMGLLGFLVGIGISVAIVATLGWFGVLVIALFWLGILGAVCSELV